MQFEISQYFLKAQQIKSKNLLCEHQALSSCNLFRICLALKLGSCCILQTDKGTVFWFGSSHCVHASNAFFCWQLVHDLIYSEFSVYVQFIHKTYEIQTSYLKYMLGN